MWYITRILSALLFLFSVVFTIPLAFDVGGRTCGLAFSLSLSAFYFFYSALRLATPDRSRFRYVLVNTIAASQWIVIPTLMIWSLNKFSVDSDASAWVEKTFSGKRAQHDTFYAWIFGSDGLVQSLTIGGWDKLLRWSTPVFQLSEGFCSLLVIQAAGQITRYLVNREGGDGWMVSRLSRATTRTSKANCDPADRTADHFCLDHLEFRLLPMENYYFPGARQCRCYPDRSCYYLRLLPLCLGHRQRQG